MEKEQLEVDQAVTYVRNAIADRATWFYLLVKEIEAAGGNAEHIARKAVFQFGCLKGGKMNPTTNMREFVAEFSPGLGRKVFANEVKEIDENHAVIEFSHCPLAACWKNLGCSPQEIDKLCDWAVDGDRGVVSMFPAFKLEIQKRIGAGDQCCRLVFTKK